MNCGDFIALEKIFYTRARRSSSTGSYGANLTKMLKKSILFLGIGCTELQMIVTQIIVLTNKVIAHRKQDDRGMISEDHVSSKRMKDE